MFLSQGILRSDGCIAEFDIWADSYEMLEYEETMLEMILTPELREYVPKESVSAYQQAKTIRKSNKKKSMEQRAKQKKVHRMDIIPELDSEE